MAATVTKTNRTLNLTAIDADWLWSTTFPNDAAIRIQSIEFIGGAANDVMVIKEGSDSGAVMFSRKVPDTDYRQIKYFWGQLLRPVVDYSDCTLNAGHRVIIELSD